jgi:hypothetical protein
MPSRLETPVLTVDVGLIHKVDTRNAKNLFSMWKGEFFVPLSVDATDIIQYFQCVPDH